MSEIQSAETAPEITTPTTEAAPAALELPADHPLVKTLAALKTEVKDLRGKAGKLAEIEESQKTESQRLADAFESSKREAAEARAEATRYRVAATHGVSADYLELLGSGDEEALTARAERVASLLSLGTENTALKAELEALKAGKTPAQIRPVADLKPGATPKAETLPDTSYPASWLPSRQS